MRNEKNRFELGTEVRLEKAGTKKGGENQKILASRGGVGCYGTKPSATRHACPARQECRSTHVWPQCGKETYHQRARLARFVAPRLAPVNRNVGATTVNCANDNRRRATSRSSPSRLGEAVQNLAHEPAQRCGTVRLLQIRSEERRVGKECRSRWS